MRKKPKASIDNRGVKTLCLALFLLIAIPNALAYDECAEKQSSDGIPCLIFLPSASDCTTLSVSFYSNGTFLSSQDMVEHSPKICKANFTYSALGTYTFNYTTGDSGSIVVTEGFKMIYLLYFAIILVIALMILGLYLDNQPVLAIDGFLMIVLGIYVIINGFSIYDNMVTQMIGAVISLLGGYFLTMSTVSMMEKD